MDPAAWKRQPGQGKYARPERERRFLLAAAPPLAAPPQTAQPRLIEDRYLDGTTLRLRRITVGGEQVHKLTQKVRLGAGPAEVATTNTYLTPAEYDRLLVLPAAVLVKTRHLLPVGQTSFVVDEFHGRLAGLWLAEIEVVDLQTPLTLPTWLGREVSHEEAFSGGSLAGNPPPDPTQLR